ncbi:MAG: bidirectional hydrogenase complex protein HoxU [Phycisphaeraceae bacterium]
MSSLQAAANPETFTIQINDTEVTAQAGQTVLQVARENGIDIPSLCYMDGLSAWGGCRLCLVEVLPQGKLLPACTTTCYQHMQVKTHTPQLEHYRKVILELMFAERNHVCSVCVSNGHCDLQDMAVKLGVTHIHVPYRFPSLPVDSSHKNFRLDHNRCILCTRCVRVCDEIEGAHTKDVAGRGIDCMIINDLAAPWGESETCTSCSKCVHVCPTGALTEKGTSAGEMAKRRRFLPYLSMMREDQP